MTRSEDCLIRFNEGLIGITAYEGRLQAFDSIIVVLYTSPLPIRLVKVKVNSALT